MTGVINDPIPYPFGREGEKRLDCIGNDPGQTAGPRNSRSSNTSTAFTIRADATQPWAGKAHWPSRLRPHK